MRFVKITAAAALISLFGTCTALAAVTGTVSGSNVNVRAESSTGAAVLTKVNTGQTVSVVEEKDGWYGVSFDGVEKGYISSDYLFITAADATVKGDGINIRAKADTYSDIVTQLNNGQAITLTAKTGNWYRFTYEDKTAYIFGDYITGFLIEDLAGESVDFSEGKAKKYATVTAQTGLNVRKEPSTSSAKVDLLSKNSVVEVLHEDSEWVQIRIYDGKVGYVAKEFVKITTTLPSDATKAEQLIAFAKQFLGVRYVYGGTNLSKGSDCSGFVYSVFKNFGYTLNRVSSSQATQGSPVARADLQMGDLVFFDGSGVNDGKVDHVGIYIGNGDYIHSSSGKAYCVTISNLNEAYSNRTYVTGRRIL